MTVLTNIVNSFDSSKNETGNLNIVEHTGPSMPSGMSMRSEIKNKSLLEKIEPLKPEGLNTGSTPNSEPAIIEAKPSSIATSRKK